MDKLSWSFCCISVGLSVAGGEKKADFIQARKKTTL